MSKPLDMDALDELRAAARAELRALRQERDTLRAKVDRLTDLFMQVEGIQPDGELGISATKVQQWYDDSQNLMTLRAEAARLREALESAVDELLTVRQDYADGPSYCQSCLARCDGKIADIHHSADCAGVMARHALASTPTTAEWLAARDEEMKRLGAAEWLEREAWKTRRDMGEFYERSVEGMLEEAARLRAGKGE